MNTLNPSSPADSGVLPYLFIEPPLSSQIASVPISDHISFVSHLICFTSQFIAEEGVGEERRTRFGKIEGGNSGFESLSQRSIAIGLCRRRQAERDNMEPVDTLGKKEKTIPTPCFDLA